LPAPPGILVQDLTLHYAGQEVFKELTLEVPAGTFVALLGPSGVGKTSLLRIIAGLEPADGGTVSATDGAPLAGRVAYMAQQDLLLPWANIVNNVMLGARLRGERADKDRARHLLERVGLQGRERALPAELSGGMRQRAALARTLYEQRPVVLMDEPFSALDAITRARIQDLAAEVLRGCTVLLITHDPMEACRLGHHLLVLSGAPARLGAPIAVPGAPPRATDDEAVLHTQGALLRALTAI
jgi:putative hydroxymethylpyrimidine transport system ATP-binding protein